MKQGRPSEAFGRAVPNWNMPEFIGRPLNLGIIVYVSPVTNAVMKYRNH